MTRRSRLWAALAVGVVSLTAASPLLFTREPAFNRSPLQAVKVVNSYPHDQNAWTQGLVFEDGHLFEGTGRHGKSSLRLVDLASGTVLRSVELDDDYFGEGITEWQDRIIQLTWKAGVGLVYDRKTFELLETFNYPTEGWGLTHDADHLVMSDGTSTLRFLDPQTFEEIRRVEVTADGKALPNLNELEYVDGEIYANVWQTDFIVRIDPEDGRTIAWIDLSGLLTAEERDSADVLNGIAYDAAGDRLFVTGKYWPKLFEIELVDPH